MTTKFQRRTIDLLTNRPTPHDHYSFSSSSAAAVNPFMDRIQNSKNIDSMRKMMLIQEEIFKHQVQELHRLYKLQKYLMQELENGLTRRQKTKTDTTLNPAFSSPIWHQQLTGLHDNTKIPPDDLKEASCSGDDNKNINSRTVLPTIKLGLDQKDSKRIDEENDVEVELTLSIGHCVGKKRPKSNDLDRDQEQPGSSSSGKTNEYGESGAYRENTRPHWLLQDLSLNRT